MKKCTASPFLCLPELCAWGVKRHPERRRGHHPGPKQPLQGRHQVHTADVPTCLPGAARRQGQDPTDFAWTQAVSPGPGGGWDRVTARELQVTRVCAQRRGRSVLPLSRGPQMAELRGTSSPPRIPVPVCLGHKGPVGWSVWPWKGCQDTRPWCCAQDCKSGKPPRSPHRWKITRVSLQAGAWV